MMIGHVTVLAQPPAHVEPVDPGQHQVQHHQVGGLLAHHVQRLLPVPDVRDRVAACAQVGDHHLTDRVVVVDDKNPGHSRTLGLRRTLPPRIGLRLDDGGVIAESGVGMSGDAGCQRRVDTTAARAPSVWAPTRW